ncbi:type IX secretion system outer membrane channel protein PorV [Dyadobacter psychrotolerans]|uniref:Type IX secretion system outer membrane channel protein PorV n=1 Tax=Dyadobacter psychrotolerans TaxID=2541721 RepID=A0A4R5DMF3_9BACT|nr:type IX secretion system outer membrane channel protein PorV [Dyadobacter psychrotolerans]TDE12075.1 type IX secretion system outer membrane channel protein PorV [Dyadobacter psychrotolerans]
MRIFFVTLSSLFILTSGVVKAQQGTRIPHSPLSFLTFAPDARSAGMGEAGVALSPDANSTYWNAAKLPYNTKDFGVSASYTPWLRNLVDDMWLGYLSAYKKLDKSSAVAISANYFDNGRLDLRDAQGGQNGYFNSKEFAINGTYSRQLGKNFSMGLTLKYISSNLSGNAVINNVSLRTARTAAGDISAFYRKQYKNDENGGEFTWSLGAVLSNLGGKVNYGSGTETENFIPTNLKLGGGITYSADGRNKFNFIVDASKLMVPTPDGVTNINTQGALAGAFGSFSDAPDGFKEELQEVALAIGAEYWYNDIFALRAGYFGENKNKGDRKFFTAGAGIRFADRYAVDFAYLFPVTQGSPLAQTLRITLSLGLNKAEKLDVSDTEN